MAPSDSGTGADDAARLRRQREALCKFGELALRADDLDTVLAAATDSVSDAIEVRLVKILELLQDRGEMLVRAGTGWKPGVVGRVTFGADRNSPAGYALMTDEPVISTDLATERRFRIPDVLREHGVKSMVNVMIASHRGPWGVLEVDSPEGRQFDAEDITFLGTYANLVGAAIERVQISRERDEALEKHRVLLRELQHRVGNLLSNVAAIASFTRRGRDDVDAFLEAFSARLAALGRTQKLLTDETEDRIALRDVLREELDAHGVGEEENLSVSGPDVALPSEAGRALGLVFHELATNAVKHGAFREPGGRLAVSWQLCSQDEEDGRAVLMRWRETGVAIAEEPASRGLGFKMINEAVPRMVGGTADFVFHPDGVEYTLRFPLAM